ncbi:transcriptional repressor NsdA [Streptacidiphilus cavernicola]|uniref:NsdA n=1 Tax=Streptacidiphilus cavernicola TaxID=3342716 RepID=A0ABV6W373_9ACTN
MGEKQPNEQLATWFVRSGWSKGELARQVNRRARQIGASHISTDTSRVRRWLDGESPREPIPKILSDLFSERFGSLVTIEDLGLKAVPNLAPGSGVDLPWNGSQTVQLISDYSRSDLMLNRRGFLGTSLALTAGSALIEPMQRWLAPAPASGGLPTGALATARGGRPPTGRISPPELALLESTVRMFRQWDAQNGGGLRRKAVVGQLHEVCDLLQETYPADVTRRLFQTTAQLAHLAGWMSYDIGMHPSAQKYYVLALHAAKEAGDRPFGALILSDMCRQMIHLNRSSDALELVHLAQYGSRDTATARTSALMHALEARAYANLGEVNKCYRAARLAEDSFTDISVPLEQEPDWITFFSEAELNAENAHSYRDLSYHAGRSEVYALQAQPVMERAVELFAQDPDHQRSYALNLIGMSSVHLLQKQPEEAAASAQQALEIAIRIRSERVNTRVRKTTAAATDEFRGVAEVIELRDRVKQELPEYTRNQAV